MSTSRTELYAELFETAINATTEAARNIPEGKRLFQAAEGKGHPLWLLGHLTNSSNLVVNMWSLGGESVLPREYGKVFSPAVAGGAPITPDASAYPAWDEVVENYEKAGAKCVEGIKTLSDDELPGDFKGKAPDQFKTHFGNLEGALRTMLLHDAYHRGQFSLLVALP